MSNDKAQEKTYNLENLNLDQLPQIRKKFDFDFAADSDLTLEKVMQLARIILQIPPSIRTESELQILQKMCLQIEFFKKLFESYGLELVRNCVQCLKYEYLIPNTVLFNAGDQGSRFYVTLGGSVGIYIQLPQMNRPSEFEEKRVNILRQGFAFGDLALVSDTAMRTATIKSQEEGAHLAFMEKNDYRQLLGSLTINKVEDKVKYLKEFEFLKNWGSREIQTLSYHFMLLNFNKNNVVIDFGENSDFVYFVDEGEFGLYAYFRIPEQKPQLKQKLVLKKSRIFAISCLHHREIFGEEKYFKKNNRQFRVVCLSEQGTVYRISYADLKQRLWDSETHLIFKKILQNQHNFRLSRAQELYDELIQKPIQYQSANDIEKYCFENPERDFSLSVNQKKTNNPRNIKIQKAKLQHEQVDDHIFKHYQYLDNFKTCIAQTSPEQNQSLDELSQARQLKELEKNLIQMDRRPKDQRSTEPLKICFDQSYYKIEIEDPQPILSPVNKITIIPIDQYSIDELSPIQQINIGRSPNLSPDINKRRSFQYQSQTPSPVKFQGSPIQAQNQIERSIQQQNSYKLKILNNIDESSEKNINQEQKKESEKRLQKQQKSSSEYDLKVFDQMTTSIDIKEVVFSHEKDYDLAKQDNLRSASSKEPKNMVGSIRKSLNLSHNSIQDTPSAKLLDLSGFLEPKKSNRIQRVHVSNNHKVQKSSNYSHKIALISAAQPINDIENTKPQVFQNSQSQIMVAHSPKSKEVELLNFGGIKSSNDQKNQLVPPLNLDDYQSQQFQIITTNTIQIPIQINQNDAHSNPIKMLQPTQKEITTVQKELSNDQHIDNTQQMRSGEAENNFDDKENMNQETLKKKPSKSTDIYIPYMQPQQLKQNYTNIRTNIIVETEMEQRNPTVKKIIQYQKECQAEDQDAFNQLREVVKKNQCEYGVVMTQFRRLKTDKMILQDTFILKDKINATRERDEKIKQEKQKSGKQYYYSPFFGKIMEISFTKYTKPEQKPPQFDLNAEIKAVFAPNASVNQNQSQRQTRSKSSLSQTLTWSKINSKEGLQRVKTQLSTLKTEEDDNYDQQHLKTEPYDSSLTLENDRFMYEGNQTIHIMPSNIKSPQNFKRDHSFLSQNSHSSTLNQKDTIGSDFASPKTINLDFGQTQPFFPRNSRVFKGRQIKTSSVHSRKEIQIQQDEFNPISSNNISSSKIVLDRPQTYQPPPVAFLEQFIGEDNCFNFVQYGDKNK